MDRPSSAPPTYYGSRIAQSQRSERAWEADETGFGTPLHPTIFHGFSVFLPFLLANRGSTLGRGERSRCQYE